MKDLMNPHFSTPLPLGLYIHIPWCVRKCPYCDFNSHRLRGDLPETDYVDALLTDLDADLPLAAGRPLESVFIGGGTPSLFSPEAIAHLLAGVRERLHLPAEAEITLEANPGTVERERFRGFRAAGVNRLSIGVQSFDDAHLRVLGRIHDAADAIRAVEAARAAGFENVNLDLMYGLPEQSLEQSLADLRTAIDLAPTHISHYQLTLEPDTLFYKQPPPLPDDDATWAMQQDCQALLAAHGYDQYEISAYARPGRRCAHNLNYWTFGDYLGIGAGAHGKLTDITAGRVMRRWKHKNPRVFLKHAGEARSVDGQKDVPEADLVLEFALNALRLREGIALELFRQRTGLPMTALRPGLDQARARDWLIVHNNILTTTETGRLFLNEVLQLFMPEE